MCPWPPATCHIPFRIRQIRKSGASWKVFWDCDMLDGGFSEKPLQIMLFVVKVQNAFIESAKTQSPCFEPS